MTKTNDSTPSFNLWTEPWVTLEDVRGDLSQHGIRDALVNAHEYVAIYDPSPLVVVGIHRLLTAILQDALNPQENDDLERLWTHSKFPSDKIDKFGKQYADRFDLFSEDKPFFQSADLPIKPETKEDMKEETTVSRLFSETPSGTLLTHYRHSVEDENVFSPAVVALGLVTIPPFATSGGRGGGGFYLMPSINSVPPIYVLPAGKTLFESLTASLISARLLKKYATREGDLAWWRRTKLVVQESKKKKQGMKPSEHHQLGAVGYLHGLTFPARKVRLHPERLDAACSRSGQRSEWSVRTMAFRMGESRLEDATWEDPFAAYKLPSKLTSKRKTVVSKKGTDKPKPIRPMRTRAAWREFTGLFLQRNDENQQTRRPLFLNQLAELEISKHVETYPFRCVAWQTDGKMKFYEWMDFGFDVPPALLQDPNGARWTEQALLFATDCAATVTRVFSATFKRDAKSPERFKRLKERLEADYWSALAGKFRQFVLDLDERAKQQQTLENWYGAVVREAQNAFDRAADATGDDGSTLRQIIEGKDKCHGALNKLRNELEKGG